MMLLRDLYSRFATIALAAGLVLGAVAIYGIDKTSRLYHQETNQRLHRDLAPWLVRTYGLERAHNGKIANLNALIGDAMRVNPSIEIYLLDNQGNILDYSAPAGRVKLKQVGLAPIQRYLAHPDDLPVLGDDPRDAAMQQVFSVSPIHNANAIAGYVYVIVGGELYQSWLARMRSSHIIPLTMIGAVAAIFTALVTGLVGFRYVTRRVRLLADALQEFKESKFTYSTLLLSPDLSTKTFGASIGHAHDEIAALLARCRELAQLVRRQVEQMHDVDVYLRETIAGLSHDLRTPLTALGGYLDTLAMKHTNLSLPERQHYLDMSQAHHQRLSRLVSAMFELTMLESPSNAIESQRSSLTDLIDDVAQKFGGAATAAGIVISVDSPNMAVYVDMDVALIERVLENLIGNALRHTPAGGTITLTVQRESGRAKVIVSDSGSGIAPLELLSIFEPFRRGHTNINTNSRSNGAGLGLAIAKKIVTLHKGKIDASSIPGKGSTFVIDLPLSDDI